MSANKAIETKIHDDENADSGFLSGPLDQLPSGFEDEPSDLLLKPDENKECGLEDKFVNPDSGVVVCEEGLERLSFQESSTVRPTVTVVHDTTEIQDKELPPLAVLFQQDDDGDTQLHIAAVHGCEKSVRTLTRVCPEKWFLDLQNDYGHTALHLAVMSGQPVVARMLVLQGASLGVRDLKGNTPVHAAAAARSVQCLHALLGALDNRRMAKSLASILNIINYNGQTCVHIAANLGHIDTLKTLVSYGADVNAIEGYAGWTSLHIAARRGDLSLTHCLLKCPGVAVRARDYAGRTPRRLAKRVHAFTTKEGQRIFKAMPEESDSETDDDEYDSEDEESLFDKIRSETQVTTSLVN